MAGKLTAEALDEIRGADPDLTNEDLAAKWGVTPQRISQIRHGRSKFTAARISPEQVTERVLEIAGDGGLTAKRARAVEMLFDAILLELDDIQRVEAKDQRGKRLSVAARALRDASDCAAQLKRAAVLEEMTDEQIRNELTRETEAA